MFREDREALQPWEGAGRAVVLGTDARKYLVCSRHRKEVSVV